MTNPKISIVIPTAECEGKKFLPRCLNSIKSQNYANYEVIVIEEGKVAHNMNCGIKKATGDNTIGGLSVLSFENKDPLLFTEGLDWMVDVDFYKRAFLRYGLPRFLVTENVVIGYGSHQTSFKLTQEQRTNEMNLMLQTYGE